MAHVVSHQPLTTEVRICTQVSPCGICAAWSGTGIGFLRVLQFAPVNRFYCGFILIYHQIPVKHTNTKPTTRLRTPAKQTEPHPTIVLYAFLASTLTTIRTYFKFFLHRTNSVLVQSSTTDISYCVMSRLNIQFNSFITVTTLIQIYYKRTNETKMINNPSTHFSHRQESWKETMFLLKSPKTCVCHLQQQCSQIKDCVLV
jgi:hypothetical protein